MNAKEGKKVFVPEELYKELEVQARKYGLSPDEWANQLLEEEKRRNTKA